MDDAALNLCLGIVDRDGLPKAVQAVYAEQVDILYATTFHPFSHVFPLLEFLSKGMRTIYFYTKLEEILSRPPSKLVFYHFSSNTLQSFCKANINRFSGL